MWFSLPGRIETKTQPGRFSFAGGSKPQLGLSSSLRGVESRWRNLDSTVLVAVAVCGVVGAPSSKVPVFVEDFPGVRKAWPGEHRKVPSGSFCVCPPGPGAEPWGLAGTTVHFSRKPPCTQAWFTRPLMALRPYLYSDCAHLECSFLSVPEGSGGLA